jgi:hypothetical protein
MPITNGTLLNLAPAAGQQALSTNYLDLASTTGQGWAQQYVPDLMEKEAEIYGPRTISGFLSQIGAEEAMTADQVVWSEQGRLHLSYKGRTRDDDEAEGGQIEIETDIDGNDIGTDHGIRPNDLLLIASAATGIVVQAICVNLETAAGDGADRINVAPYGFGNLQAAGLTDAATGDSQDLTILVYGSEFGKGVGYNKVDGGSTTESRGANEPGFRSFSNKPIILKDYYEVSGSDASRVGWIEITSESGASGYLWYLKAEADTRARFTDYLEMAMLESKIGGPQAADAANSIYGSINANADLTDTQGLGLADGSATGTQGLFDAIETRGNVTTGVNGINAATDLAEFDAILAEFDRQGAIEENMLFVNRATSLAMDDMLASMNSYGAGGTSYGVFDNSEDMALNLGFSGFRRGSYDFYKSDFRYLNDLATRGGINTAAGANAIRGVIIPAGTSTVYDQTLGKNFKRPFLHVRYRASQTDDRRMKTWTTGSVGAATTALDAMQIHFLSERCLVTQGANNFMLMK